MKLRLTKWHFYEIAAGLIVLFCLRNAMWVIWLIYLSVLLLLWILFHRRLLFLSSLLITFLLSLFFINHVLSGVSSLLTGVHWLINSRPVLLYEGTMKERPIVSIIMPAYNYEKYVAKALDSAAQQDFPLPYEVVVVEDGSPDKTLDVLLETAKKYSHVRIYAHTENQGLVTTKNQAIELAHGEWIFNLDADDWVDPDALSTMYRVAMESKADMAYTWFIYEGDNHGLKPLCPRGMVVSENCVPNSIFYRKSDWRKFGGYSYLFAHGLEDWNFWLNYPRSEALIVRSKKSVYHYLLKKKSRQENLNSNGYEKNWWLLQASFADRLGLNLRILLVLDGFNSARLPYFHALLRRIEADKIVGM